MSRASCEERRLLRLYERAMDRLDEFDRRVFLGHRVEELSYRQLAERHGVSITDIEQAIFRGLTVIARFKAEQTQLWWQFWRR